MIIKRKIDLKRYTTFKMGGIVEELMIPETIEEVKVLSNDPKNINYLIGGGSNLLINDSRMFEKVILLTKFNEEIKYDNGYFIVGASVRLQKLIMQVNKKGYGGIEYLYSVPGTVGGAVYMNAGRGIKHNKSISDYICEVNYIENGEIKCLQKKDCEFGYRDSIFQHKKIIITSVKFKFKKMSPEEAKQGRDERLNLCKKVQDMSRPTFGTVFCEANPSIMNFIRIIGLGRKCGVHFSKKTKNWMLHEKDGSFKEAYKLICFVQKLHRIFGKKCKVEVKIWK